MHPRILFLLLLPIFGQAQEIRPDSASLFLDFKNPPPHLQLFHGAAIGNGSYGTVLEFSNSRQYAEVTFSNCLDGVEAVSIGGWFFPRRSGEQFFLSRGTPQTAPGGELMFQRQADWVNFVLGTDFRGFFLGTINGNGTMPFPHVTVDEVQFGQWHQLVVVKDKAGVHKFYHNGTLAHSDCYATSGSKPWPFIDAVPGEPLRLSMPLGGLMGEVWVLPRELSSLEIKKDFSEKSRRFNPALPVTPVSLREMNAHPDPGLWREPPTAANWPDTRERILEGVRTVLGKPPDQKVPLAAEILSDTDCGSYRRLKVSLTVQPDDRMPLYLLIPREMEAKAPAIVCFYGTTSGAGKDTTVGLSGLSLGSEPQRNFAFALDMVAAGFVAAAPDYLRDGERVKPGRRPYETVDFYEQFPDWSIHGKDAWDTSRLIDYLQSLPFVDSEKIGMVGHSYGGHSTIFSAALDPRIKVAVANGPVSDFRHHGMHWAVPKGGGNSQSMPAMRPYILDHTLPLPVTFYEFTALIAPRPLLVGQAVGERRPMEEENYAAVSQVYTALGTPEKVCYHWYAGDHDFPPEARAAAATWFKRWFKD